MQRASHEAQAQASFSARSRDGFEQRKQLQQLEAGWKAAEQLERNTLASSAESPSAAEARAERGAGTGRNSAGGEAAVEALISEHMRDLMKKQPALWPDEDEDEEEEEKMDMEEVEGQEVDGEPQDSLRQVAKRQRPDVALEVQLGIMLQHLRAQYCYCMFCGCAFGDVEDMASNCPGVTEDEH